MASLDGILSPPANSDSANSSITLSAKRKRDDSTEAPNHVNGTSDSKAVESPPSTPEESQALIRDLIDVLKSHDTTPSILRRAILESGPNEPQAKRHKADVGSETITILTRHSSQTYSTIEEVLTDIDLVVSDIKGKLQLPDAANNYSPSSPSDTATNLNIVAFQKKARSLVEGEMRARRQKTRTGDSSPKDSAKDTANVVTVVNAKPGDSKLVLTLYGNAPGPKQLFSSLQIPAKVEGGTEGIVQTLREAGLPNGITTTEIVPVQPTGLADDKKRVPTLGELFPTPSTVPALQPPKPSKIAITRSATVGWYQPNAADPHPKHGSYFKQSISTGQWLDYSSSNTSTGSKRKRDRALSLVGAVKPQLDTDSVESEAAKLEALFRSAYSGFAPSRDDAAAIVPEGTMNRVWWQNIGEKSFERLVQTTAHLDNAVAPGGSLPNQTNDHAAEEEESFEEAVENFIDPDLESVVEKPADEKEVDEVLDEISELLRTLNSHQRNRHLNLNASGRAGGLLSVPDTTASGTPTKPSDSEISIYEILKSQLTLMIASLPPYAVAKLDSDQLSELAISTKIEITVDDYKGVMEEDEASARSKAAVFNATSVSRPVPTPQPHRPSSTALYGNQYASPRPAAPAQHQYYGQSQTPIRPPVTNFQRPAATAQAPYNTQRTAAATTPYRPNSYGTPGYPHQAPRPQQQYTPQYNQQATNQNYNRPAEQQYQGVPQSAPPVVRYAVQPSYSQQAAAQNGTGYQFNNNVNAARQVSPQKPLQNPQTQYNPSQPRPTYGTPGSSMPPDRRPYLAAQANNGAPSPSPQPQVAPQPQQQTGYSTFMTAEQQASMMDRQRAHLAQQQQTLQQTARSAAQAAMGSPSKSQVNGNAVPAGF